MTAKYADLHVHTDRSDGSYSPQKVVELARAGGLSAVAITDHDSIEGVAAAISKGRQEGVEVIPGIELSALVEGEDIHVLGYFIDINADWFSKQLAFLRQMRKERAEKIVEKLNGLGVGISFEEVLSFAGKGAVGRLHVARTLFTKGYIRSIPEAFWRYIGKDKPAYVAKYKMSVREAVEIIHRLGGVAVLAHPHVVKQKDIVSRLVAEGIDGVEVYHSEHARAVEKRLLKIAKKYQLLVAGGSDCHGACKGETLIGTVKIPYEYVIRMKEKVEKNAAKIN